MSYNQLKAELAKLVEDEQWGMLRTWFNYWDTEDEKIDKCLIWCRFFLPHYFRDSSPSFQRDLIAENLSNKNEYTAIPRGYGKTTTNQGTMAFEIANRLQKFIVVVEKTYNEAAEVINGVVKEFRDNAMIKQVYGSLVKVNTSGEVDERNKDAFGDVFINGIRLRAKGFNAPIRGLKSNEWRPTKIYIDDVESDEHINSEDQRRKYRENYSQGIVPAVDINGTIKVRGTILHNDSLLKNLIDQFHGKIYKAFDKDNPGTTLLWPERWSYDALMRKKAEMEMQGKGSSKFYQEYLNEPVDDEYRTFRWEWLQKRFTDDDLKFRTVNRFAMFDVALSKNEGSDYTGKIVIDWDQDNNLFIQRAKRYKVNVLELVDLIFETWQIDKPLLIGVEKKAFQDQIQPLLKQRSEQTGIFPIVVELEDGGKRKEDRVKGALQGRAQLGMLWFKQNLPEDQGALLSEFYDFPHAKKDDLIDASAYIEQIGHRPMGKSKSQMSVLEQEFYSYKQKSSVQTRIRNL